MYKSAKECCHRDEEARKCLRYIESTANDAISKLPDDAIEYLKTHPDPGEHHFGIGLWIRNNYIYPELNNLFSIEENIDFFFLSPDTLSNAILECMIEIVTKE